MLKEVRIKINVILFVATSFLLGLTSGYILKDHKESDRLSQEIELLTKNQFVYESDRLADTLLNAYQKYQKNKEEGDEYTKRVIYMAYDSLVFSDSLNYFNNDAFLLEKREKYKALIIANPIKPCVSVEESKILDCYEKNLITY